VKIKDWDSFYKLILFGKKIPHEISTPASIGVENMFLLTGKIGKAHKVRSSPCFYDRQNPRHFLAWRAAKTLAYYVFPFF